MTARAAPRGFAERPGAVGADAWVGAAPDAPRPALRSDVYAARLTIDVTTAMRGRIKVAAFQRGETVADMLRALFEREFPDGAAPS
jgi:hypothetical protein